MDVCPPELEGRRPQPGVPEQRPDQRQPVLPRAATDPGELHQDDARKRKML